VVAIRAIDAGDLRRVTQMPSALLVIGRRSHGAGMARWQAFPGDGGVGDTV